MYISVGTNSNDLSAFEAVEVTNLKKLSEIICQGNYSLSTFDGPRRKQNFIQTRAIGLDFDGGYTLDEALRDFAPYVHIIAPTKSHRKEKNGVVSDRFRVILILAEPITDVETFEATWFSLAEKWPQTDKACKDASRYWAASTEVVSANGKGELIKPVAPKPKEKKELTVEVQPGQKGKLGRTTQDFLKNGVTEGGRNNATVKAAKDFQQNLYSIEEATATIVNALNENGTIASDFTEEEVIRTVRSAYSSEAKHEPRIKARAFKLVPISELANEKVEIDWLVDGLLQVGGVSLISGDPKSGKSTIARQLCRDVLCKLPFLGRTTKQGVVQYYGIEEHRQVLSASFRRLGVIEHPGLLVHVGDPLTDENVMSDLEEILLETKPALVILDTVFDVVQVPQNDYDLVKREFRKLRRMARASGAHIMLVHHNSKGQKDDRRRGNRAILGSTAISGGVDTIIVVETEGETRLVTTSGREIRRWARRELVFDSKERTYSLGPEIEDEDFL